MRPHDRAHAVAAVAGAEVAGAGGGEAGERVGAHLRRARAEPAVGGTQLRRQLDRRGRRSAAVTRRDYRRSVARPQPSFGGGLGRVGRSIGASNAAAGSRTSTRRMLAFVPPRGCVARAQRAGTVPLAMPRERVGVAERERDVAEDREPHADREPVVHERRAGAQVVGERVVPLQHDPGAEQHQPGGGEERRVEPLAEVELARVSG